MKFKVSSVTRLGERRLIKSREVRRCDYLKWRDMVSARRQFL